MVRYVGRETYTTLGFVTLFILLISPALAWASPPSNDSVNAKLAEFDAAKTALESVPPSKRGDVIAANYMQIFASSTSPRVLSILSTPNLQRLLRASYDAYFFSFREPYLRDMENEVAELERRRHAERPDYYLLFASLIKARQFDRATALSQQHASMDLGHVPTIATGENKEATGPYVLESSDRADMLMLKRVSLNETAMIVVVAHPLCHFSQNAARAISANPRWAALFQKHSLWLMPQDEALNIGQMRRWQNEHPDQPLAMAFNQSDWTELDDWSTPIFYFLKHGSVVYKVTGWPPTEGDLATGLRAIGLQQDIR